MTSWQTCCGTCERARGVAVFAIFTGEVGGRVRCVGWLLLDVCKLTVVAGCAGDRGDSRVVHHRAGIDARRFVAARARGAIRWDVPGWHADGTCECRCRDMAGLAGICRCDVGCRFAGRHFAVVATSAAAGDFGVGMNECAAKRRCIFMTCLANERCRDVGCRGLDLHILKLAAVAGGAGRGDAFVVHLGIGERHRGRMAGIARQNCRNVPGRRFALGGDAVASGASSGLNASVIKRGAGKSCRRLVAGRAVF